MKKTSRFREVLNNLRSASNNPAAKVDAGFEETLSSDHFQLTKSVRHGFPFQPTAMAYDPVQNLLAIGTRSGSIRILGRPGVDFHLKHDSDYAVIQLMFVINDGALVSVCADDQLHMWNLRQRKPEIVHSLKFQKDRITYCHLPFRSNWLYVGVEKGNVHIINIESFTLSGYVIMWNKALDPYKIQKSHPGPVVHLSDNHMDPNQLLIGYDSGLLTLFDLQKKEGNLYYSCPQFKSASWHHEGKQFMCSHGDGSLTTWNLKSQQHPEKSFTPHAKPNKDGRPEACRPIMKVDWRTCRTSEPYVVFSGGLPVDKGSMPSVTIMRGQQDITVFELDYPVIDFLTICSTPWSNDFQDPVAVVVLQQSDFVVIDLTNPKIQSGDRSLLTFENPYPMDLHDSPVTACLYLADCLHDLIPAFCLVGCRQKRRKHSEKEWPIKGGACGSATFSYLEVVITGHADGSLKFWDASAVSLQVLYKLKTAKAFDTSKSLCSEDGDNPYAIQQIELCAESRLLCVAGLGHVMLFKFCRQEAMVECVALEINLVYELYDDQDSPEIEFVNIPSKLMQPTSGRGGVADGTVVQTNVKIKSGARKWPAGYQPSVCCMLTWTDGEPPPPITSLAINSKYGLLAFGNDTGLVIVDLVQKVCLFSFGTPDLYGSMDPYTRMTRSPKLKSQSKMQFNDGQAQGLPTEESRNSVADQFEKCLRSSRCELPLITEQSLENSENNNGRYDSTDGVFLGEASAAVGSANEQPEDLDRFLKPTKPPRKSKHRKSVKKKEELRSDQDPSSIRRKEELRADLDPSSDSCLSDISVEESHVFSLPELSTNEREKLKLNLSLRLQHDFAAPPTNEPLSAASDSCDGRMFGRSKQPKKSDSDSIGSDGLCPVTAPVWSDKTDFPRFGRSRSRKLFNSLKSVVSWLSDKDVADHRCRSPTKSNNNNKPLSEFELVDLSSDDCSKSPRPTKLTYAAYVTLGEDAPISSPRPSHSNRYEPLVGRLLLDVLDKTDNFSRSQSSSVSSLETVSKEIIQCLTFADSYIYKTDLCTCSSLWIGTSLGSVLVISLTLPTEGDSRKPDPVISPSGTIFRLKGSIVSIAFVDANGLPILAPCEPWKEDKQRTSRQATQSGLQPLKGRISPSASTGEFTAEQQFAIVCSDKQARAIALPSQTCAYKVKITETSCVAKASVITIKDSACLACFLFNGHIMTFSVPSLKPLFDVDYIPSPDVRMTKTFCFSNNCHVLYFCSPTELQKVMLTAGVTETMNEMFGELFLPCEMPEPPKQGFFQSLFGNTSNLDREELFGEASGKPQKNIAKLMSKMDRTQEAASLANSEIGRAKMAALERGEKLGELEERTERMRMDAEVFSQSSHQLQMKYKDKKWYQW